MAPQNYMQNVDQLLPFLGDVPYFSSDCQRGHASQELQPPFGRQGGSHLIEPTTQQFPVPSHTQAALYLAEASPDRL